MPPYGLETESRLPFTASGKGSIMNHIAWCGVDCAACPDYLSGKCPNCRRSQWPDGEPCMPVACCQEKGILSCGACEAFPCPEMREFYEESDSHRQAFKRMQTVARLRIRKLTRAPALRDRAADWFHSKWGVPLEAYLDCMDACLSGKTTHDWYLCLDGDRIVGGLGVIDNDFHDRKDLTPNVCAVYTEPEYRGLGVAGRLLNAVVADQRAKGVSPLYLVTDHTGFYEQYGWEFLCPVRGDGEPEPTRMYIHR